MNNQTYGFINGQPIDPSEGKEIVPAGEFTQQGDECTFDGINWQSWWFVVRKPEILAFRRPVTNPALPFPIEDGFDYIVTVEDKKKFGPKQKDDEYWNEDRKRFIRVYGDEVFSNFNIYRRRKAKEANPESLECGCHNKSPTYPTCRETEHLPECHLFKEKLKRFQCCEDWESQYLKLHARHSSLIAESAIMRSQLDDAIDENEVEQAFVMRLCERLNEFGIDTSDWDSEDDPATAIADCFGTLLQDEKDETIDAQQKVIEEAEKALKEIKLRICYIGIPQELMRHPDPKSEHTVPDWIKQIKILESALTAIRKLEEGK